MGAASQHELCRAPLITLIIWAAVIFILSPLVNPWLVSGQGLACTSKMLTSFLPCMSFLTGSGLGSSSPVTSCCKAVGDLMSTSSDCTCFLFSGGMPFGVGLPFNRTVAFQLPSICGSSSVPLFQCNSSTSGFGGLLPLSPNAPSGQPSPVFDSPSPIADGGLKPFEIPNGAVTVFHNYHALILMLVVLIM